MRVSPRGGMARALTPPSAMPSAGAGPPVHGPPPPLRRPGRGVVRVRALGCSARHTGDRGWV